MRGRNETRLRGTGQPGEGGRVKCAANCRRKPAQRSVTGIKSFFFIFFFFIRGVTMADRGRCGRRDGACAAGADPRDLGGNGRSPHP